MRATLAEFGLHPDVELAPLPALPNLAAASAHLRCELGAAIERFRPSVVIVQGDTLTAHAGALAARDAGCRLAHVEAGLRTPSITNPFPEEWFRRRIALHATWHFAPSPGAVAHLRREGVAPATIHCVGNPGIDSLRGVLAELPVRPVRDGTRVIVTLHRRENYDANADAICRALLRISPMRSLPSSCCCRCIRTRASQRAFAAGSADMALSSSSIRWRTSRSCVQLPAPH